MKKVIAICFTILFACASIALCCGFILSKKHVMETYSNGDTGLLTRIASAL